MGNIFSDDTCCTISGKDFNAENNKYVEFMQCCDRNNCCVSGGRDACSNWLDDKDASYTICANACNGQDACIRIGSNAEKSGPEVTINQGACDGEKSCSFLGVNNRDKIDVGTKSCVGNSACEYLGRFVEKESISLDWGSCVGPSSCTGLGYYSIKGGVDVGYLSCRGERACYDFGYSHEQVTVGNGVCTADFEDSECYECYIDSVGGGEDPLIANFFPPFFCPYNN